MSAEEEEPLNERKRANEICYVTDEDEDSDEWIPGESNSKLPTNCPTL